MWTVEPVSVWMDVKEGGYMVCNQVGSCVVWFSTLTVGDMDHFECAYCTINHLDSVFHALNVESW